MNESANVAPWTGETLEERYESFMAFGRKITPERRAELDSIRAFEEAEKRQSEILARRIANARKYSDLGERFETRRFRTYLVPPGDGVAKAAAYDVARDPKKGAWFHGGYRAGKTHLAAAIVNSCHARAIPAAFITALGLLDRLKQSYDRDNRLRGGEYDIIDEFSRLDVLVIDDLDKAKFNEWASSRLYALINRRFERHKPLIVTTNATPAELSELWAQQGLDPLIAGAIGARMREMCRPIVRVNAPPFETEAES